MWTFHFDELLSTAMKWSPGGGLVVPVKGLSGRFTVSYDERRMSGRRAGVQMSGVVVLYHLSNLKPRLHVCRSAYVCM